MMRGLLQKRERERGLIFWEKVEDEVRRMGR